MRTQSKIAAAAVACGAVTLGFTAYGATTGGSAAPAHHAAVAAAVTSSHSTQPQTPHPGGQPSTRSSGAPSTSAPSTPAATPSAHTATTAPATASAHAAAHAAHAAHARTQAAHTPVRTDTPGPQPVHSSPAPPPPAASHGAAQALPMQPTAVSTALQHSAAAGGRSVALTFDDGPDPRWTPQILDLLAKHHAKATFCEIGPEAAAHPELVRAITAAGDALCDHSVHHDEQQSTKSVAYNRHEIVDAQHEITQAAGPGAPLWFYRAPGGDFSPVIRDIAAGHGLRPLAWTVDSEDWKRPGVATILNTINSELKPGGIILMHDGGGPREQTVQALSVLLDRLDAAGYTYSLPGR